MKETVLVYLIIFPKKIMATKLPNGKYRAQVFLGVDESGKRQYKSFIADSADEADFLALSFKLGHGKKVNIIKIIPKTEILQHECNIKIPMQHACNMRKCPEYFPGIPFLTNIYSSVQL